MKQIAVYLMLRLDGNVEPSREGIAKALETVGIQVDKELIQNCKRGILEGDP
jgi:ribosomal protein L12E/L44/L45/RPP1/RPP2